MVNITNLTSGKSIDGSYTSVLSASITPLPNSLILVSVASRTAIGAGVQPNQPTITGCGLTWAQVDHIDYDTSGASRRTLTLFSAFGPNPSTGALTIDFGGQAQSDVLWIIDQATVGRTTGLNGIDAIVQSAKNSDEAITNTVLTVTLAAFKNLENATYGVYAESDGTHTITPGSGFSELIEVATGAPNNQMVMESEWKNSNDTTVDWTSSGTIQAGGIAIEIATSSSSTPGNYGKYGAVGNGMSRSDNFY